MIRVRAASDLRSPAPARREPPLRQEAYRGRLPAAGIRRVVIGTEKTATLREIIPPDRRGNPDTGIGSRNHRRSTIGLQGDQVWCFCSRGVRTTTAHAFSHGLYRVLKRSIESVSNRENGSLYLAL